jgi:hypothetical protein
MKKRKKVDSSRRKLKDLLRSRIRSLQGEMQQFALNPAFMSNVKFANAAIIKSEIALLQDLLDAI